jgi:hypothetical protein
MAKKRGHPLEGLTFNAPKLEEVQPAEPPAPALSIVPAPEKPTQPQAAPEIETRSSNVTLPANIWEWIDAKHAQARSAGGKPMRKAAIIRAVFDAVMAVEVDLSGAQSEEDIAQRIIRAIRQ